MPSRPERPGSSSGGSGSGGSIVDQLRAHGIRDPRLLEAFGRLPRAKFVPPRQRGEATADRALPIGCDQTISQPFIVAVMTLELALTGNERVLEIGTGSGYQTALLADLAREVFTVERHATLSLRARSILDGLGKVNIRYKVGDGTLGWADEAPFDRVLVTAAAPEVPSPLFAQLVEGGLMVLPVGGEDAQDLTAVRKLQGRPVLRAFLPCRFVKLIGEAGWGD